MKKQLLNFLSGAAFLFTTAQSGAQSLANFDALPLASNSYFQGAKNPKDTIFESGTALFPNGYSGIYWMKGWAYSNVLDTTNASFTNLYGARTGKAYDGQNYAIGQENSTIHFRQHPLGTVAKGIYITNTTYAYGTIQNGSQFSKKFGGASGTDPDYFKLTISSYFMGSLKKEKVEFYLADFRAESNANDYIVKDWTYVDLTSLGGSDSLLFTLASSDTGEFGINTPLFFAIDQLYLFDPVTGMDETNEVAQVHIHPNPATESIYVDLAGISGPATFELKDLTGKTMIETMSLQDVEGINISDLVPGIYLATIQSGQTIVTRKVVKK